MVSFPRGTRHISDVCVRSTRSMARAARNLDETQTNATGLFGGRHGCPTCPLCNLPQRGRTKHKRKAERANESARCESKKKEASFIAGCRKTFHKSNRFFRTLLVLSCVISHNKGWVLDSARSECPSGAARRQFLPLTRGRLG